MGEQLSGHSKNPAVISKRQGKVKATSEVALLTQARLVLKHNRAEIYCISRRDSLFHPDYHRRLRHLTESTVYTGRGLGANGALPPVETFTPP